MGKISELVIKSAEIYERETGTDFDKSMEWTLEQPLGRLINMTNHHNLMMANIITKEKN